MIRRLTDTLPALYKADETAWLEAMADLIQRGQLSDLDYPHLGEYLSDMARRDRREVFSRLVLLLAHLLKWEHQPDQRTNSWRGTILTQRRELRLLLESGTLRRYAGEVMDRAYRDAVEQAATETALLNATFPEGCPWSLAAVLEQGADAGPT